MNLLRASTPMSTPRDRAGRAGDAPALHLVRDDDGDRGRPVAPGSGRPTPRRHLGARHRAPPSTRPATCSPSTDPVGVPPDAHQPGPVIALVDPPGAAVHAVAVVPRPCVRRGGAGADQHRDARALREGRVPGLRQGARAGLRRPADRPPAHRRCTTCCSTRARTSRW